MQQQQQMTDRLQFAQLTSLICEMLYFEGY